MIQRLYSIRDTVSKQCSPPICAVNDGVAMRNYQRLAYEMNAPISDLELYYLGVFNDENMSIEMQETPFLVSVSKSPAAPLPGAKRPSEA